MKRTLVYMVTLTAISALSLVGCTERTEVEVQKDTTPDTVIVPQNNPDKEVNVNVKTENAAPAPVIEHKDTTTSTTVDSATGTTTTTQTETNH